MDEDEQQQRYNPSGEDEMGEGRRVGEKVFINSTRWLACPVPTSTILTIPPSHITISCFLWVEIFLDRNERWEIGNSSTPLTLNPLPFLETCFLVGFEGRLKISTDPSSNPPTSMLEGGSTAKHLTLPSPSPSLIVSTKFPLFDFI